jgi:hypothetical protein
MSDWIGIPDNINDYFGVVYLIRNNIDNRYYIGIKQLLKKTRLKANKSRKKDKIVWKDNNIEGYWGSSTELLKDIEKHGKENFTREVIELCNSKFHLKLAEIEWQMKCKVLFSKKFYNQMLNCRLGIVPKNYVDIERNPDILKLE